MAKTEKRKSLAEQLTALMAYRNRPEEDAVPEPLQSNWKSVAANDNAAPEEVAELSLDRELHITPSVGEIMRQVALGPVVRNDAGQIIAIGRLRFSDGTQHERAYTVGPDGDLIRYDRRMPTGAMLGTREKVEGTLGGKGYTQSDAERSNDFFAASLGTGFPRYIKRIKRRNGPSLTPEQSKEMIDDAIANTEVMPPVTLCPPSLPCAAPRVAESFLGMQPAATGQSGSIAWQDVGQVVENRKVWRAVKSALRKQDVDALDAAMTAQTLADIAPGGTDRGARKRGKRMLLAANDNLSTVLKKYAG